MSQQHPITPPPELVEKWANHSASVHRENGTYKQHEFAIATQAAQWSADQELEACCQYISKWFATPEYRCAELHAARRPKPSLKVQALHELNDVYNRDKIDDSTYDTIRRALEQL